MNTKQQTTTPSKCEAKTRYGERCNNKPNINFGCFCGVHKKHFKTAEHAKQIKEDKKAPPTEKKEEHPAKGLLYILVERTGLDYIKSVLTADTKEEREKQKEKYMDNIRFTLKCFNDLWRDMSVSNTPDISTYHPIIDMFKVNIRNRREHFKQCKIDELFEFTFNTMDGQKHKINIDITDLWNTDIIIKELSTAFNIDTNIYNISLFNEGDENKIMIFNKDNTNIFVLPQSVEAGKKPQNITDDYYKVGDYVQTIHKYTRRYGRITKKVDNIVNVRLFEREYLGSSMGHTIRQYRVKTEAKYSNGTIKRDIYADYGLDKWEYIENYEYEIYMNNDN